MATLKRTRSSNPVWAELEALAIQYKSLPPAPPQGLAATPLRRW